MEYYSFDSGAPCGFPSPSVISEAAVPGSSSSDFIDGVEDCLFNTDEQAVLDAEFFAFYKGVPVIKVPNSRDAFSCGIIFIGDDVSDINTVKHEYGHYVHLTLVGIDNYVVRVVLPSVIGYASNVPYDVYYSQPWEYIAEILGGVNRNNYNYSDFSDTKGALYMLFTLIG
jgi:hypothetical protein